MKTTKIRGFDIEEGKCYKILIAKFVYYIRIEDISENPFVVLGKDIYGKNIQLNLGKASLISEYDCLDFENRSQIEEKVKKSKKKGERENDNNL